jgi:hypothetical protein
MPNDTKDRRRSLLANLQLEPFTALPHCLPSLCPVECPLKREARGRQPTKAQPYKTCSPPSSIVPSCPPAPIMARPRHRSIRLHPRDTSHDRERPRRPPCRPCSSAPARPGSPSGAPSRTRATCASSAGGRCRPRSGRSPPSRPGSPRRSSTLRPRRTHTSPRLHPPRTTPLAGRPCTSTTGLIRSSATLAPRTAPPRPETPPASTSRLRTPVLREEGFRRWSPDRYTCRRALVMSARRPTRMKTPGRLTNRCPSPMDGRLRDERVARGIDPPCAHS